MITLALTLLFASAGLFAISAIAASIHHYGPAAIGLRRMIAECPEAREIRITVTEVFAEQRQTAARILRPEFGVRPAARLPQAVPLRAAA
jgi:hypothetical protein